MILVLFGMEDLMNFSANPLVAKVGLALFSLTLFACSSKVSDTNFEKIVPGMSEQQVSDIMGLADESRSDQVNVDREQQFVSTRTKWHGDSGTIVVYFENGTAQSKRFYKPGEEPKDPHR